jgi:tryptophan synthase alpha chain
MTMGTHMKNKIDQTFANKSGKVLSAYFTAGFPNRDDTALIMKCLQEAGADIIEVGIPFSDPVADGPTIQMSNKQALDNWISLKKILGQIRSIKDEINIPVLLMGYLNPIYQYGLEKFCVDCQAAGVSGLIVPDLPVREYLESYRDLFELHGLYNIFLITPETSEKRILEIDALSHGFIYMVSASSTTGSKSGLTDEQIAYFKRIQRMNLKTPRLVGFGISDRESFEIAAAYADGAIIGSAIIHVLRQSTDIRQDITSFIRSVKVN